MQGSVHIGFAAIGEIETGGVEPQQGACGSKFFASRLQRNVKTEVGKYLGSFVLIKPGVKSGQEFVFRIRSHQLIPEEIDSVGLKSPPIEEHSAVHLYKFLSEKRFADSRPAVIEPPHPVKQGDEENDPGKQEKPPADQFLAERASAGPQDLTDQEDDCNAAEKIIYRHFQIRSDILPAPVDGDEDGVVVPIGHGGAGEDQDAEDQSQQPPAEDNKKENMLSQKFQNNAVGYMIKNMQFRKNYTFAEPIFRFDVYLAGIRKNFNRKYYKIESKMAFELTDTNFQEEVLDKKGLTVVDFWAEWCGPCKMISPIIEELAEDYKDKIVVGKVNVDDNPELSIKYGIRSIPTILFVKDGEVVDKMVGAAPKQAFVNKVDEHLN